MLLVWLALTVALPNRHDLAEAVSSGEPKAEKELVALGRPGLWAISGALDRHPGGEPRVHLVSALGAFPASLRDAATWLIRQELNHPEPEVRRAAVLGFGRLGDPSGARVLLKHLDDPDREVRRALALTLALLGQSDRMGDRLDAPEPMTRDVAVRTLARKLSGDEQRRVLSRALADPDPEVRRTGIEFATTTRDPAYTEALARIAHRGEAEEAQLAAEALRALPERRIRLARLLGDPEAPLPAARVAFSDLRADGRHALDHLLPPLLPLDPARRDALAAPLLERPTETELADLLELLSHWEPERVALAKRWLTAIGDKADEAAVRALPDADPARAAKLRAYLSERPERGLSPALFARMKEGSPEERRLATQAVAALGAARERRELLPQLSDLDPGVRAVAAAAVADLAEAEPKLVELASDPSPEVRAAAIEALCHHPGPEARRARRAALEDGDRAVRLGAIGSFFGTEDEEALGWIAARALNGGPEERAAAVAVIASSQTTRAAVLLVELVTHADPKARQAAFHFLSSL